MDMAYARVDNSLGNPLKLRRALNKGVKVISSQTQLGLSEAVLIKPIFSVLVCFQDSFP